MQFSGGKYKIYILSEFIFWKSKIMIEVIVKNGWALVEGGSCDDNTFIDIFLCLKNVLCELVDLVKKLR